jgi:membrane protease YdiL (CAAX protease family)
MAGNYPPPPGRSTPRARRREGNLAPEPDGSREAAEPAQRISPPKGEPPRPSPERLVRLALGFYAVLLALAVVWRSGLQSAPLWRASAAVQVHGLRDGLLGLLGGALVIALSSQLTRRTRAGERLARALAEVLGPLRPEQAWLLAGVSGVAEAAFFRGALQPVVGLVAASVLFAAAHFVPRREMWLWSLFSLGAGLLLGGLYEATGALLAPIVTHVVVNGVNLNRLVREYGPGSPPGR